MRVTFKCICVTFYCFCPVSPPSCRGACPCHAGPHHRNAGGWPGCLAAAALESPCEGQSPAAGASGALVAGALVAGALVAGALVAGALVAGALVAVLPPLTSRLPLPLRQGPSSARV